MNMENYYYHIYIRVTVYDVYNHAEVYLLFSLGLFFLFSKFAKWFVYV